MPSYNKVILIGNLTRDPQLSYLPNQTPVCEIGLAVNQKWKDNEGNQREDVCFVDCCAFGKQAETINQYLSKGSPVMVEGKLQFDQWEKDGQKRSKHRVKILSCQFLGSAPEGSARAPAAPTAYKQSDFPPPASPKSETVDGGDEIPF